MKRIALLFSIAASAATFAASAPKATFGDLGMNPQVVTNVDFSGLLTEEEEFRRWTNGNAVLHGPLRLRQDPDFDYVDAIISSNGVSTWRWLPGDGGGAWINYKFNWWDLVTSEKDPTVPTWAKSETKPSYTATEVGATPSSHASDHGNPHQVTASQVGAPTIAMYNAASNLAYNADTKVNTVNAYLAGDDARVVVTNYDSTTAMPSLSFQQKMTDGGSNWWRIVWNELTRWNWLQEEYLPTNYYNKGEVDAALGQKADRAFGFYDSHTGLYAPDGFLWISSPRIAIAAGMSYQRRVTTSGAVWVLESNGLVTETSGVGSNGFFRVSDDEGNSLFEVVKGNKRTVGATANGVEMFDVMNVTHMLIHYSVEGGDHPTVFVCDDLTTAQWHDETSADCIANVSWTGSSGDWTAEVWGKSAQPKMFVKAEYETGGETYIKNSAPVSAAGGILCTDGIHKCRPVYNNGTITWEVVP